MNEKQIIFNACEAYFILKENKCLNPENIFYDLISTLKELVRGNKTK